MTTLKTIAGKNPATAHKLAEEQRSPMDKIDEILGELARQSYQTKNGNKSYLPLVAQAKASLLAWMEGMLPEKHTEAPDFVYNQSSQDFFGGLDRGFNACLDEIKRRITEGK